MGKPPTTLKKFKNWLFAGASTQTPNRAKEAGKSRGRHWEVSGQYADPDNKYLQVPRKVPRAVADERPRERTQNQAGCGLSRAQHSRHDGLTPQQGKSPTQNARSKEPSRPRNIHISNPKASKSLHDFASGYPPVQSDQTTRTNAQAQSRAEPYVPDRQIMEVAKGKAKIVNPSHKRKSQFAVVRKAVPLYDPDTDPYRKGSTMTTFEMFLGHSPPGDPDTVILTQKDLPGQGSPSIQRPDSAALSVNGSIAKTWLRYENSKDDSVSSNDNTDSPLFPHRDSMTDKSVLQYLNCQDCGKMTRQSVAATYNGPYYCKKCAAKEENQVRYPYAASNVLKPAPAKSSSRKKAPKPLTPSSVSTSTTLKSGVASQPQVSPRTRRKDVPPAYENMAAQANAAARGSTRQPGKHFDPSQYRKSDESGNYPHYHVPPIPPLPKNPPIAVPSDEFPASPSISPLSYHAPRAAWRSSSIYSSDINNNDDPPSPISPSSSTGLAMPSPLRTSGKLCRGPTLPHSAIRSSANRSSTRTPGKPTTEPAPAGQSQEKTTNTHGHRRRSSSNETNTSYRAYREASVIEAYASPPPPSTSNHPRHLDAEFEAMPSPYEFSALPSPSPPTKQERKNEYRKRRSEIEVAAHVAKAVPMPSAYEYGAMSGNEELGGGFADRACRKRRSEIERGEWL